MTVRRYIHIKSKSDYVETAIGLINEVMKNDYISSNPKLRGEFNNIVGRLQDKSFKVAVVGEFSSGKSTFLNALLQKDILKHGVKETTATITRLINAKPGDENYDKCIVYYSDGRQEVEDLSLLETYTTTTSSKYQVSDDIERVDIYNNIIETDYPVMFIDTPGLNGIADKHRQKTIDLIKSAHACIYLMQVRGLSQSDIEFIRFISSYQHDFIFVQNFIDELNALEGETVEEKLQEQVKILNERVFFDKENIHFEICGVSSRKALIARELSIKYYHDNSQELNESQRQKLYEESDFEKIIGCIERLMENNQMDSLQLKSAIYAAEELLNQICGLLDFQMQQEEEQWENSKEAKLNFKLEKLKTELETNREVHYKKLNNFIMSESDNIRRLLKSEVSDKVSGIESKIEDRLKEIQTLEALDEFTANHEVEERLNSSMPNLEKELLEDLYICFQQLLNNAVLRIREYTGSAAKPAMMPDYSAAEIDTSFEQFGQEDDEILQLKKQLAKYKAEQKQRKIEKQILEREAGDINSTLENNKKRKLANGKLEEADISRLGNRPEPEIRQRTETKTVYRGGFGILDAIFGPKTITKTVNYEDYSKSRAWDKKKSDIKTSYKEKEDAINAQNRFLKFRLEDCREKISHSEKLSQGEVARISGTEKLILDKVEELKAKRELTMKEYLKNIKEKIMESVRDYLYEKENIQERLLEFVDKSVVDNREKVNEMVALLYDISMEERIKNIIKIIDNNQRTNETVNSKEEYDKLQNITYKLEECACQM